MATYLERLLAARRASAAKTPRHASLTTRIQNQRARLASPAGPKPAPPIIRPGDFFVPEIDIAKRATRRGAEDLLGAGGLEGAPLGGDLGTRLRRLNEDYQLGLTDVGRQETEGGQDYGNTTEAIKRNFTRLALAQNDAGRGAGLRGGYQESAAATRAGNQQIEQAPVDLGYKRLLEGLGRERGRLSMNFERGGADINTEAERVRREGIIGLGDLDLQNIQAGLNAGYSPPGLPAPAGGGGGAKPNPSGPSPGPGYSWNGTRWVHTGPSPGPGYAWNGTSWVKTGPSPGKGYKWNGTRWVKG